MTGWRIGGRLPWARLASLVALSIVAVLLLGGILSAAPDDQETLTEPDPQAGLQNQIIFNGMDIDQAVFQQHGGVSGARKSFDSQLKLQITELNRICSLSTDQQQKLALAGQGDIQRFFDQFAAIKRTFEPVKHDQQAWNKVWQKLWPLQAKLSAGLFADRSFFAKVVDRTLDPARMAKYRQSVEEHRRFHYRASIEVSLCSMENQIAMRSDQHTALARLLYDGSKPPLLFGTYDYWVVVYRLRKLPADRLRAVFPDNAQRKQFQRHLEQYGGMEHTLVQEGYLTSEETGVKISPKDEAPDPANDADVGVDVEVVN
jgi:hypothetical protein